MKEKSSENKTTVKPVNNKFKPLLARNVELDKVQFPLFVQPKYDGERLIYRNGEFLSRAMKPIQNKWIQEVLTTIFGQLPERFDFDGEIQVEGTFRDTSGMLRNVDRQAKFIYHVFDAPGYPDCRYIDRATLAKSMVDQLRPYLGCEVKFVETAYVSDMETLLDMHCVNADTEALDGTIIRNPDALYKYGRSTLRDQQVLKMKDFDDDEAVIIGFTERMHNTNEAQTNELGRTFRSSAQDGLVPTGLLATYKVEWRGVEFDVTASGSLDSRKERWDNRVSLLGKLVKFQYQGIGNGGKPRFPTELGLRHEDDL